MVEFSQFLLLALAITLSFFAVRVDDDFKFLHRIHELASRPRLVITAVACVTVLGCFAVAGIFREPAPRVHDEFSYLLMSNTLASGHASNPSPPL